MNFDGVEFGSVLFSLLIVHNYTPWLISSFSMYCFALSDKTGLAVITVVNWVQAQ